MKIFFITALILVTAHATAQTKPQADVNCREGASSDAKPQAIEFASNKPFLRVRLNGSRLLQFILDTGSSIAGIDNSLVSALGFHEDSVVSRSGGAGESGGLITRLLPRACEEMGGARLANAPVMSLAFSRVSSMEGKRVEGILGGDFFRRYVIVIDYVGQTVHVLDPSFEFRGSGTVLPITVEGGHMFMTASLRRPSGEYVEGKFMIDTGVRVALIVNRPFAHEKKITEGLTIVPQVTFGIGIGGETHGDMFRLPELQAGPLRIRDVISFASTDTGGVLTSEDFAGIIGAQVLRRYKVTLDYPHARIVLENSAASNEPFGYDASGMTLIADGPNLDQIKVLSVVHASPAYSAEVRDGDVIVEINHQDAGKFGLERVRQMLREDKTDFVLKLRRGAAFVSASFKTQDLLNSPAAVHVARAPVS